jgi:hypothetical protein
LEFVKSISEKVVNARLEFHQMGRLTMMNIAFFCLFTAASRELSIDVSVDDDIAFSTNNLFDPFFLFLI